MTDRFLYATGRRGLGRRSLAWSCRRKPVEKSGERRGEKADRNEEKGKEKNDGKRRRGQ